MAYDLSYFFDRRGESPEAVLEAAVEWIRDTGLDVGLGELSRGTDWAPAMDWVASELLLSGEHTGLSIEIHSDDPIFLAAWESAAGRPGAPAPDGLSGVCILTLSGATHDAALERMREYWRTQRAAAELDEVDGFRAS